MKSGELIRAPIEGEILAPEDASPVFLKRSPFVAPERSNRYIPPNSTIAEVVDLSCSHLPAVVWPHIEVLIGEHVIPRERWHSVRAKFGTPVTIRVMPAGKAGKNILRSVLMIAVVVGLTVLTGPGGALSGTLFGSATAFTAAAVALGSLVATLALNALIPPPGLAGTNGGAKYRLANTSNAIQPYQPIPRVFGKMRVYPCVVGVPYSEVVGKEQYLRIMLMVGYGPIAVSDIRIGTTPFLDYAGSSYEINEGGPDGWAGNAATDLYARAIKEQQISINVDDPGTSIIQTTDLNTQEISIDVTFPSGLTYFKPKGNGNSETEVDFNVRYRPVGTSNWLTPSWEDNPEGWCHSNGVLAVKDNTQIAIVASGRWTVPVGQYEVTLERTTPNEHQAPGNGTTVNDATWTALRSVTTDVPVVQQGVCLIAVRLKATKALNGVPATINCLAEAYLPTTTDGTTWTYNKTRSPAWAFCDIYRRRGPETMLADKRIDIAAIQAWDAACAVPDQNGEPTFYFDGTITGGSIQSAASEIAAVGRAAPTFRDGKFSVVMDAVQNVPVQHITPRNSWGYSGSIAFADQPHALRVQFMNEDKEYAADELIVYSDGYSAANATKYELLDLTSGVVRTSQAHREGRYHLAVGILRPETHTVSMDIEALRCTRGDLVLLTHDVILVGLSYGRILQVYNDGNGNVTGYQVDNECPMLAGTSYTLRVRHADNTTSILPVQTVAGYNSDVTFSSPISASAAAAVGDLFMFGETGKESFPCVVSKIERGDDLSCDVTMVPYNPAIFTSDTSPIPPYDSLVTNPIPPSQLAPPAPLVQLRSDGSVTTIGADGTIYFKLAIDIFPSTSGGVAVQQWEVQFQAADGTLWVPVGSTGLFPASTTEVYEPNVQQGSGYSVRARSISADGNESDWTLVSNHTVVGITAPVSDPTGITITEAYQAITLRWTNPTELNFGYIAVTGSSTSSDPTQATLLAQTKDGTFTHSALQSSDVWEFWLQSFSNTGVPGDLIEAGTASSLAFATSDTSAQQVVADIGFNSTEQADQLARLNNLSALVDFRTLINGQGIATAYGTFVQQQQSQNETFVNVLNTLGASINGGSAFQLNLDDVYVTPTESMSTRLSTISATFGSQTGEISSLQSVTGTDGGVQAKAIFHLDVYGNVSGMEQTNNGAVSAVKFLVDQFQVVSPNGGNAQTVFSIANNVVSMSNVVVDTLKINTAIVPVRSASTTAVTGSYSSTSGTPTPKTVLSASITLGVPGFVEVNAAFKQSFGGNVSGGTPWAAQLLVNGNVLPESLTGGTVPGDSVVLQGAVTMPAGTYTVALQWDAHSSIQLQRCSLFAKGYPNTQ